MRWQTFLYGRGAHLLTDGVFDTKTEEATRDFQAQCGLRVDGVVGNRTICAALREGYQLFDIPGDAEPAVPPGLREALLRTPALRRQALGVFEYRLDPQPGNPEHIHMDEAWISQNLLAAPLPEHVRLPRTVTVHRRCARSFEALWSEIRDSDLLGRVLSWNGAFVPRLTRGSVKLSLHAYGAAFDINAQENKLGHAPPLLGELGSVREIAEIAQRHGWFWGGHFRSRLDGMHFEATARALDPSPAPAPPPDPS